MPDEGTPVLRADATDDDLQLDAPVKPRPKAKKPVSVLSCPVCGLEECKHNLPKIAQGNG